MEGKSGGGGDRELKGESRTGVRTRSTLTCKLFLGSM